MSLSELFCSLMQLGVFKQGKYSTWDKLAAPVMSNDPVFY